MATKKDFEATARIISAQLDEAKHMNSDSEESATAQGAAIDTLRSIAHRFADHYARENNRFDRTRFMKACGSVV